MQNVKFKQIPNDTQPAESNVKLSESTPTHIYNVNEIILNNLIFKETKIIERVYNNLSLLLADESPRSVDFYNMKMKSIEHHWESVQNIHRQIVENTTDIQSTVYDLDAFFDNEEEIQNMMLVIQERCQSLPTIHQASQYHATNSISRDVSQFRLPKIQIPKFNGDYLQWRQFHDLFTELVHNQTISPCQKMWYLKTSVTDDAEVLIRHLSISNDNYNIAWTIIKNRYDNKRLIVTAMIHKLLSQPTAHTESAASLKLLHDTTRECLLGLNSCGIETVNWDPLLLHILIQRLHKTTHSLWEQSLHEPRLLPSLDSFLKFIETRYQSLEALGFKQSFVFSGDKKHDTLKALSTSVSATHCIACKAEHPLFRCPKFLGMSPKQRLNLVQEFKHCANCLKSGHRTLECNSRNCVKCNKKHNTLLHLDSSNDSKADTTSTAPNDLQNHPVSLVATPRESGRISMALLSTILVHLTDVYGNQVECRALLDNGSQANFITQRLASKLGLRRTPSSIGIEGIGQTKSRITERVNILLKSKLTGFSTNIDAHILPRIVSDQPSKRINIADWHIPTNIKLADPKFQEPRNIDLLIGAGLFFSILSIGQIRLGENLPILQNSLFGWIVSGDYKDEQHASDQFTCGVSTAGDESLNAIVERFWVLEECDKTSNHLTAAEQRCEDHFIQNVRRNHEGRFIVRLPFQGNPHHLGETRDIALQRLKSIERKLIKNPELKKQYVDFMREFINLGHMEPVDNDDFDGPHYFLPHHCVLRPSSSTTKLRVVFDASAKTSTNISLNDILATGPTIQNDVFTSLLRFRLPRYVFAADIEKMFRQIEVAPEDRQYQLILWREDPDGPPMCFRLTTVTYGTTSAPYLATRCLVKLAEEEQQTYPLGAECLKHNFYVDDVLTGADQISIALETQSQLRQILEKGKFHLRKWCANDPRLLQNIPISDQEIALDFSSSESREVKTMGLTWNPKTDDFSTKFQEHERRAVTKRTACSDIARMFDPLGFFAPVVSLAKIFLRKLWELELDWDASLPQDLHTEWISFREDLHLLQNIKIPRHVYGHRTSKCPQIHIFVDASEEAYGAVAYFRSVDSDNTIIVRFLCAKSRVAPVKKEPIPRLELCAAKLGAELKQRIQKDLDFKDEHFFLWSDNTSVLGWINAQSSNYHTFVANRISAIQKITSPSQWRYVNTRENPADPISRGLTPGKLVNNNFWYYGPVFLHGSDYSWTSQQQPYEECLLELRQIRRCALPTHIIANGNIIDSINHKNSFRRLQRIIAYVVRFINQSRPSTDTKRQKAQSVSLTADEMEKSLIWIIKIIQKQEFAEEIKQIENYKCLDKHNFLSSLSPTMDEIHGILRVGGRLDSALLSKDAKHPMLLPYNHPVTKLLVSDLHRENLHAAPLALLSIVRQRFWPVKGKTLVRSVVKNCVKCSRANPQLLQQMMGNLPPERVQPGRPFVNTGVDFLGPVWTHFKIRGKHPQKSYVAVFCCFASKAVHMELVSDLSTDAFLGALKRFMARRGQCRKIYCDNATNFVGASNQLQELQHAIHDDKAQNKIIGECSKKNIEFSFIPPRAPHFGGLWEAAVKSAKHLIRTTMSSASLTYEEMQTLLAEAEAIMNSRPLTPMSNDPNDLTPLTPGHLLIGEPIVAVVDPHAAPNNASLLTRWKLVAHLKAEFWRRWTHEYLNHLQHRYKWKTACENVKPGTMVIIKEDNRPPLQWSLGRIHRVIRGEDGLVRVADVRTATNIVRRPIHRLSPLPMEDEEATQQDEVTTSQEEPSSSILDRAPDKRSLPSTSKHRHIPLKRFRH